MSMKLTKIEGPKLLNEYTNGNYKVEIFSDGTKIRSTEEDEFKAAFPENIDVKLTNRCFIGCKFCFPDGTPITKADGTKDSIENIKLDMVVKSFNLTTKQIENKPVKNLFKRKYEGELIVIHVSDDPLAKPLELTPNHKVYTSNGWKRADELTENDEIYVDDL